MKPTQLFRIYFAAVLLALASTLASSPLVAGELAPIFDSAAGRYFLRELGLGESVAISAELESRLASDLERVRAKLESERGAGDSARGASDSPRGTGDSEDPFKRGAQGVLTAAQETSLRNAFIEQGQDVREFLKLGERPANYASSRERFLSEPPLPKGKGIVFEAQRPDILSGRIYRIELQRDNVRLGRFADRFEQGAIDDFLRKSPRGLEAYGVRVIEKLPSSTVIEVPDVDALNARIRLRGYGPQFELAASPEVVPVEPYLRSIAAGLIPVAPVGADARMFTHDLLVHAIAITAFLPAQVSSEFAEEAAELLRVYRTPEIQASPEKRAFVKAVMRAEADHFDQQTAQLMVWAASPPETRDVRLAEVFKNLSGGKTKAQSLLSK